MRPLVYQWITNLFLVILLVMPVLIFFRFLHLYGVNIPYFDDYALLKSLVDFNKTPSFLEKIRLLFAQHNEHRIFYDRLIVWIIWAITGEINYVTMMWVGNFSLFGVLWLLYRQLHRIGYSWQWLVPFCWLIFSLAFYENAHWGMAALQNFTVISWILLAVDLISDKKFVLGTLIGVFAILTSGNGILILPVGIVLLASQKNWKVLGIFTLTLGFVVSAYFYGYQSPPGNPTQVISPMAYLRGFSIFLGSAGDILQGFNKFLWPIYLVGVLVGVSLIIFCLKTFFERKKSAFQLVVMGWGLFLLASTLIVVHGRLGFGENILLTSRYKIYSVLGCCVVILVVLSYLKDQKVYALAFLVVVSVAWNCRMTMQYLDETDFHQHYLLSGIFSKELNLERPKTDYHPTEYPFQFSCKNYDNLLKINNLSNIQDIKADSGWSANGTFYMKDSKFLEQTKFIFLRLQKNTFCHLFPCARQPKFTIKTLVGLPEWKPGLLGVANLVDVPTGYYKIGRMSFYPEEIKTIWLPDSVGLQQSTEQRIKTNW